MISRISRRHFIAATGGALLGASGALRSALVAERRMTIDLVCGAIGVRADQKKAIELAHRHGFESVAPDGGFLSRIGDADREDLLATLEEKRLVFGAAGLPVDFRRDEAGFRDGMKRLEGIAVGLKKAGVTRVGTWISPGHGSLTYVQNFKQHARRLREVAKLLSEHGLRFGLEYVGPKTSWTRSRHPFVHTMAETKDLIAEIGEDNMGFVLDSWHWYTAKETEADLLSLKNRDIVAVDLNDAPAGIPVDEQIDSRRELPAATGVIDLKTFLGVLEKIGYDGPVRAEPFNAALRKLPPEEATAATARAMKKAFSLLGV